MGADSLETVGVSSGVGAGDAAVVGAGEGDGEGVPATVRVGEGDAVAEGQPLGSVGETGSLTGPSLYFEVRRGRRPLDPASWLEGDSR